ncbi:TonB-dependent siderophore receptor [Notoacmeibacter ruber]|uniref:TonB-dependent siderophore receptor n=1 Tax=Notoacmeibacter ruber TaxID=2670375 RepID=A0A3L7JDL3_9HYPH|nr:TonB-dependent siderophore receptor [Notoacmeibacter ruber]RLQ88560.1 TonB-dependent siderophore receptor [Notoacmeibacter ruber]
MVNKNNVSNSERPSKGSLPLMVRHSLSLLASASTIACFGSPSYAQTDSEPTVLEQITVEGQGEAGDGPVEGYIAKSSRTGTKTDTPIEETPQTIFVVPADQVEDQGAQSVAEALRYTPGVFTEYRGSNQLYTQLFMRGFYYTPIFVDGLQFGDSSARQISQMDPWFLERLEVLKGPSSILYGQSNPGGIANLVTKKPTGETGGEAQIEVGSNSRIGASFDLYGTLDEAKDWSYRLVGTGWRTDLQEEFAEQSRFGIAPSLTWQPTEQTSLTLQAFYLNEPDAGYHNFLPLEGTLERTSAGYIPRDFFVSDPDVQKSERQQFYVGYQFEHAFENNVTVRQNARYSYFDLDYDTLISCCILSGTETTIRRNLSRTADGRHQFSIDNQAEAKIDTGPLYHTILGGLDYRYTARDYDDGTAYVVNTIDWTDPDYGLGDVDYPFDDEASTDTYASQLGLYLQDQIEFGNLHLAFGLRYDLAETKIDDNLTDTSSDFDADALTYRAGAIYNFENGIAPFVSYSTSFEPSLESPDSGQDPFDPTTGEQFEIGVKYAPDFANWSATATYFDITQNDIVMGSPWTGFYQVGEIRSRGFEFEARAEIFDNLSIIGSYAYLDSEIIETTEPETVGKMPQRTPNHLASLWSRYEFDRGALNGLSLGGGVRYIGESWADDENTIRVPDVALFDAAISYDFAAKAPELEGLTAQINVQNIADERYIASCANGSDCFYGNGRTITGYLKYKW